MKIPSIEELLEAGVHFGHRKERWNPKMKPFIFTIRESVHIINLEKTQQLLEKALEFISQTVKADQKILFVGTKKQAQPIIVKIKELGMPYIDNRWFGGTLTNFRTITKSIRKLEELEKEKDQGKWKDLIKKERGQLEKKLEKLQNSFGGIRNMKTLPAALFVIDLKKEKTAVKEANTLNIPIIAICDTNADPEKAVYPIPGNDDAIKSIQLIFNLVFNTIKESLPEKPKKPLTASAEQGQATKTSEDKKSLKSKKDKEEKNEDK